MSKRTVSWMRLKQRMLTGKMPEHRELYVPDIPLHKVAKAERPIPPESDEKAKPEKLTR
jgi:hypothetical protein